MCSSDLHESGGRTDRAAALSSVFGSMAIAVAPFALGALADSIGFHTAFLLVPLLLGIAWKIGQRRAILITLALIGVGSTAAAG